VPNALITPSLIARVGLATLYNTTVMAGLVWRDFDPDFAGKQGDTITIRKPAVFAAQDFNRATGIVLQAVNEGSIPVVLDHLADVSFPVTSEELTLKIDDFSNRLLTPAMEAIVQKVDTALGEAAVDAAKGPGGGGTAVMDAKASDVMIEAREKLTTNKLPLTQRYGVLSPGGTSKALSDPLFVEADTSGSTDALREANIGRVFGIDTYESQTFGYGPGDVGKADGAAFHRTAITLASRALEAPMGVASNQVAIESFKGLTLRVVFSYDAKYKQDVCSVDFLYGIAATRPEGAVALDMGIGS
jgi:P22 coat protein - gene protein 5